ncbi:pseudouridine synthase, partial [bacterium]|nr:pseudouridine synthase [bacterium]
VQRVEFRGKEVTPQAESLYIMIHKPKGILVTNQSSRETGSTVFDLIDGVPGRLFSVGRLDRDTTGLLILTNDGALAQKLAHPSSEKEKEYLVEFDRPVNAGHLKKLERGVLLDDGVSRFKAVKRTNSQELEVILTEGRKRQIRRTFKAIDLPVKELHRQRIGKLTLGKLKVGEWRKLSKNEVAMLLE